MVIKLMESSVERDNSHYKLPLPFKNPNVTFPNNRSLALARSKGLRKKLLKDKSFYNDYKEFMESVLEKGYAKKSTTSPAEGKVWYIPHHGVYHPNKPGKIRVV